MRTIRRVVLATAVLVGCNRADPPQPTRVAVQPVAAPASLLCPGGLLCEAHDLYTGWRIPAVCVPTRLGQRIATCWLDGMAWAPVVEFFASRYPHMTVTGPQLRIAGQAAPLPESATPSAPLPTPPLVLGHQRPRGVELVFLAGDVVDTAHAPTETEGTLAPPPAVAPIRRMP